MPDCKFCNGTGRQTITHKHNCVTCGVGYDDETPHYRTEDDEPLCANCERKVRDKVPPGVTADEYARGITPAQKQAAKQAAFDAQGQLTKGTVSV